MEALANDWARALEVVFSRNRADRPRRELRFWTDSRRADFVSTNSEVRQAIYRALSEAGICPANPNLRVRS